MQPQNRFSLTARASKSKFLSVGDRHALRVGFTIEKICNLTKIDRWFLGQIKEIVDFEEELAGVK